MKNKKAIVIATTSLIVVGLLYLAVKKATTKDITNDPQLRKDYEAVIKKIDEAKK